jgi:hypothetical protein
MSHPHLGRMHLLENLMRHSSELILESVLLVLPCAPGSS